MAARHPLSALKLSCRTLKHVVMAAAASSSSSSSENACILLLPRRIDDPCAGDRAPRNDNDKDEKELEEEEEDEEEEADLGLPVPVPVRGRDRDRDRKEARVGPAAAAGLDDLRLVLLPALRLRRAASSLAPASW